ncbi:MAG TPA: acyl-CoA dehydrogenase [Steroidobacteraceae bacterium]|nr:acyl-CoA dehydrogenase [Steroidobacteraceae bacterium]
MYQAPLRDLRFVLDDLLGVARLAELPRYRDFSIELTGAVLEEAANFAQDVLAPINRTGDRVGASWREGAVQMPTEFRNAYRRFVEGGWTQLSAPTEFGGQGAPLVLSSAVEEIDFGANMAFTACPLLSRSAAEAIETVASKQLQSLLLPRIVSGEWTGTMNLTEPQAGSDLAAIRTRATPDADHFRITGQKIFITYGEHDLTPNIVHLVLARIDGAPSGIKGISLFAVPKFLIRADGTLGARNDVRCVSIEHKLGIHASPTCVMAYGDAGGAFGYLVGQPHRGLEYMFIMMNAARLSVGIQGVGLSELARQQAAAWAHSRIQGRPIGIRVEQPVPIVYHPDVRRMMLTLRANVEAMRALMLSAALQLDLARAHPDEAQRATALTRGELLIPIVKGWCTEQATQMASLAIQVHGGMGFIEETGVAQTLRDARIAAIYEGTTAIQANDLLGRKLGRDRGAAMAALLRDTLRELNDLRGTDATLRSVRNSGIEAITVLRDATEVLLYQMGEDAGRAYAVSVPYLMLCGRVLGGALLARSAALANARLSDGTADPDFYRAKLQTARFYAEHLLPESLSLLRVIKSGGACVSDAEPQLLV